MNSRSPSLARVGVGCFFMLPAVVCCIGTLLIPTIQTINNSFLSMNALTTPTSVGMANYTKNFQDPTFATALKITLLLLIGRVVAVAIVPPILALALNQFGRAVRIPVRLLYSVPLALFAPVSLILSWRLALSPTFGLFGRTPVLGDANNAPLAMIGIDALTTFGIACGVGMIVYLIALRGTGDSSPEFSQVRRPLVVTWIAMVLTAVALSLQVFTLPYALTNGGPGNSTLNLSLMLYRQSFQFFQLGAASSLATVMLIPLGILGLVVAFILIISRLNLQTVDLAKPFGPGDGSNRQVAGIVLALGILGSGVLCALSAYPQVWTWLASLLQRADLFQGRFASPSFDNYLRVFDTLPVAQTAANSVIPIIVGVLLIQMPVSYLAALGIGGLRPLGRHSEWLLLLFSPWLFVTIFPLSISDFVTARSFSVLNTFIGLIVPIFVNVPILFILTLFFKGKEQQWRREEQSIGSFFQTVVLPSLPFALLLAGIAVAVSSQDVFWPLITAQRPELRTLPLATLIASGLSASDVPLLAAQITLNVLPSFVLSFVVFAVFQIFYLDRLAMGFGEPEDAPTTSEAKPAAEESKSAGGELKPAN